MKNFIQGIKNLFFYFNVIWKDRWYDSSFILILLRRKFQQMDINWGKAHYVDSEVEHKIIKEIVEDLTLLIEDDFFDYNKYQEIIIKYNPNYKGNLLEFLEMTYVSSDKFKEFKEDVDSLDKDEFIAKKVIKKRLLRNLMNYERLWD